MWPFGQSPTPIHCLQSVTPMDLNSCLMDMTILAGGTMSWGQKERQKEQCRERNATQAGKQQQARTKRGKEKEDSRDKTGRTEITGRKCGRGEIKRGKEEPLTAVCLLTQNNCF